MCMQPACNTDFFMYYLRALHIPHSLYLRIASICLYRCSYMLIPAHTLILCDLISCIIASGDVHTCSYLPVPQYCTITSVDAEGLETARLRLERSFNLQKESSTSSSFGSDASRLSAGCLLMLAMLRPCGHHVFSVAST
jgi:hypothetical protein